MRRFPVLRRFVVALIGLALLLPSALPSAAAAAPAVDGLAAALSFVCSSLSDPASGEEGNNQAGSDHASCQACAGACHGMTLDGGLAAVAISAAWTFGYAVPRGRSVSTPGAASAYASRAPPLA